MVDAEVAAQRADPVRGVGQAGFHSWPGPAGARPVIWMASVLPSCWISTAASRAPARAAMRSVASAMRKYPADSAGPGNRSCGMPLIVTGMGLRSASASTAAARPSSASTAG